MRLIIKMYFAFTIYSFAIVPFLSLALEILDYEFLLSIAGITNVKNQNKFSMIQKNRKYSSIFITGLVLTILGARKPSVKRHEMATWVSWADPHQIIRIRIRQKRFEILKVHIRLFRLRQQFLECWSSFGVRPKTSKQPGGCVPRAAGHLAYGLLAQ